MAIQTVYNVASYLTFSSLSVPAGHVAWYDSSNSCLDILLAHGGVREGEFFSEALNALDVRAGIEVFVWSQLQGKPDVTYVAWSSSAHWGAGFLPLELRDYMAALTRAMSEQEQTLELFPDILPIDLQEFSASEITAMVARYCGCSVVDLDRRLRPGGASSVGFLEPEGDDLGTVIKRDWCSLKDMGVNRHELAEILLRLIRLGSYESSLKHYQAGAMALPDAMHKHRENLVQTWGMTPDETGMFSTQDSFLWNLRSEYYRGHQEDPFHSFDSFCVHGLGSGECVITNKQRAALGLIPSSIKVADLLPLLIRRLCFFEQSEMRVDPEDACVVLGLLQ